MELTTLKATSRVLGANRDNARLRKAGQIPAVYYGKGMEAQNIAVSEIDLRKVLAPGKRYTLLDLEIDGKAGNPAVVYNYQKDAITQKFVHIDFIKISDDSMVKVRVPVKLSGLPVGVKTQGGIFSQETRYLMLAAKPACIPTVLEMDISEFGTNITFYAKDFKLPEGVELASGPRTVIFTISSKSKKKEEAAAAEAPAAAAPAAAAAAPAAADAAAADKK
jgi:large subunit ribosomal protein L25